MIKAAFLSLILLMQPGAQLADPREEARAQRLMREIRCVACENEPISQSASDIAITMRTRVRSLVADGKSDQEVRDWFSERYGEFVLFRPSGAGIFGKILWGLPFVMLLLGASILARRRRPGGDIETVAPDHDSAITD